MTRTALGIVFACLFASTSLANGFEVPSQPDFSLQRTAANNPEVDRSLTTGSIKSDDTNSLEARQPKHRHHVTHKLMAQPQP